MECQEKGSSGRGGAPKKKVTEAMARAERHRAQLTRFMSRSGCAPCDRSEAGFQYQAITKQINELSASLTVMEGDY